MMGLFPTSLFTVHKGKSGGRGLSPRLWSKVANQALSPDGSSNGYFFYDDYLTFANTTAVATNVGRYASQGGGYLSYEDTGGSITQLASEVGGAIRIATDTTDNDEVWMQPGMATSVMGKVASSSGKLMIFETRFRVGQVTDSYNIFLGMSEEGLAAADTVTDAGALADKDFLGFWVTEADGDSLKFGYRKAGGALQTIATVGAIAASTWYKVGFVFDPDEPSSRRIKICLDNIESSTYVTGSQISASTFPDGEELNFLAGLKNGAGAIKTLDLDWTGFFQAA